MIASHTRQRRKEARPKELLDAALDVFVRKGFAATRTDEVAARAGVSKGTLYLYYPSKEELLKAVIRERLSSAIAASADEVSRHGGSAADLLGGSMVRWWRSIFDSPASGVFKLIITEVRNFPEIADFYYREVVEPGHRLIGDVLRRGIGSGEFRPVDVDATVTYTTNDGTEHTATVDLSYGTSDRTDGAPMDQSDLTVAQSAIIDDVFAALAVQGVDVTLIVDLAIDASARVKALNPGKGKGRQNNPFSDPATFALTWTAPWIFVARKTRR